MSPQKVFKCSYRGCGNKSSDDMSFFKFPKDLARAESWIKACNREDFQPKLHAGVVQNHKLCEEHFEEKYIVRGQIRNTLLDNAVPTLFSYETPNADCTTQVTEKGPSTCTSTSSQSKKNPVTEHADSDTVETSSSQTSAKFRGRTMSSATRKMDKRKIQHSYVCAYWKCGIRSRDNIPGIKFHKLPLNNKDVVAGWLINAGLDERADDPEHELRKIVVCSRHFPRNSICPTGRLKKGAMPFAYDDNGGKDDDQSTRNDRTIKDRTVEREILLKKLEKNTAVIRRQEMRIKELATTIDKKSRIIKKLKTRLYLIINSGIVDDDDLAKALGRRFINRIQTSEKLKLLEAMKDEPLDG